MTKGVKTIAPTAAAEEAWNAMRLNRIHHLVVTTANRVVGVLSDRDAGGRRGGAVRENTTVAELMNAPAVTVEPTTTVRQAANVMRGRSIGCLVVVESLPSELQSDESTDTKVQLPPQTRIDTDSDAIADKRSDAASG